MADPSLHMVYRAVIVAKLTYVASAWWSYACASDRSRLEAVLRRGKRSGLCSGDATTIAELVSRASRKRMMNCSRQYCVTHTTYCTISCRKKQLLLWI